MEFYKKIRQFFSTSKGRDVLLYLLFVGVSFVFWAVLTLGNSIQHHYRVKLQIEGLPQGVTLISDYPSHIDVSVKNDGYSFLRYLIADEPSVSVNFSDHSDGEGRLGISRQEMEALLQALFGADASVETFSPDHYSIRYTALPGKKVPVSVAGSFTTDIQYVVNGKITVEPDSALVYSYVENLSTIDAVSTVRVSRANLKDTLLLRVPLRKLEDVKTKPDSVTVTVPVEPLVSKQQEVLVGTINCPAGLRIVTFPARVKTSFLLPLSLYDHSQNVQPHIYVDYRDVAAGRRKLPLRWKLSGNLHNVELAIDSVEYIIE